MSKKDFMFLDEPLIFEWLSSRQYMAPIFTENFQEEPIDPEVLKRRLFKAIADNVLQIRQNNHILKTTLINTNEKPSFHYESEDRNYFRKKEFLTKEYNTYCI
jgi:hypothetical protein